MHVIYLFHDDVIKWKHFPRYWPFMRGIHRSPANSPHKVPATQSFDVFFDLRLINRLSKQWWGWWFETPLLTLWRHCNLYSSQLLHRHWASVTTAHCQCCSPERYGYNCHGKPTKPKQSVNHVYNSWNVLNSENKTKPSIISIHCLLDKTNYIHHATSWDYLSMYNLWCKPVSLYIQTFSYTLGRHHDESPGLILGLRPANERRRYKVTTSVIGWVQA